MSRTRALVGALFVVIIWWHLLSDAPTLGDTPVIMDKSDVSTEQHKRQNDGNCAPREGVIIVNVLGLLANDMFEIAFANRLSEELCWPILYRPYWNAEIPSKRSYECFPKAGLPRNHKQLSISSSLQQSIQLNASTWERWALDPGEDAEAENEEYEKWLKKLKSQDDSIAQQLPHLEFDFTGNRVERLVDDIRLPSSHVQVVSMQAFFIHYDWMKEWMPRIRQWLTISPDCCKHNPPSNAVVMHVRDFDVEDGGYNGLKPSVYVDILQHYRYSNRSLWIVCQPKSAGSPFVQEIIKSVKRKVTIVTGIDQYDAFCTLTRAKTLILSYVSSYSQMAALLNKHGDEVKVHYPLTTLDEPEVTLAVPGWKYHLVKESLDGIDQWDVGYDKIKTKMA